VSARLRALLWPALFTFPVLVALIALGNWQVERLGWKEDLIARATERPAGHVVELPPPAAWPTLDIAGNEYRPFRLEGRFRHDLEALVFTSLGEPRGPERGPGYWVVTPFELGGGGTVLVNRGFAPQGRHLPAERGETLDGVPTSVVGLLRPDDPPGLFTPDHKPEKNLFFAREIAAIAAAKRLSGPVAPFTIDLVAAHTPPGGLPQAGETRMRFTNNHLGYAVTWYGLALALAAVFLGFARTRWRACDAGRA